MFKARKRVGASALVYAVKLGKRADFLGRAALLRQQERGPTKRLGRFLLDDPDAFPWGGEGILRDGKPVGEITSAGYSARLGRAVVRHRHPPHLTSPP